MLFNRKKNNQTLGTPQEDNPYKKYYFVWMGVIFIALLFSMIAKQKHLDVLMAIVVYGIMFAVSLGVVLFDTATKKRFDWIDTVTIEKPRGPIQVSPKIVTIVAVLMGVGMLVAMVTTGKAWVAYPTWNFFDSKVMNAILSGILGVVENQWFFVVLFPTTYAMIIYKMKNPDPVIAFLIAGMITTIFFSTFHFVIYGTTLDKMFGTVLFSWFNIIVLTMFRNIIISDVLHLTNNIIGVLIQAGLMVLWVL